MRSAYERLTSILSDPDECGMSALDCIYEIMENEVQTRLQRVGEAAERGQNLSSKCAARHN